MRTIRTGWNQLLVTLAVAPFVIPLAVMVGRSVGGEGFLRNYGAVLNRPEMLTFLRNSVVIAAGTVAVTFVCTMLASYALAKLPCADARWRFT
ncbi:hypothetical protein ACFQYP_12855 [Nonomuraea antimicrobica]